MLKNHPEIKRWNEYIFLSQQVSSRIQQRTHSRVQGLQIDVSQNEISVFGRVGSYHVLQLALEEANELQSEYRVPVRVQVQVFQKPSIV